MTRKTWPNNISINQLAQLTGKDRRTVTKALEGLEPIEKKSNKITYDIKEALQLIFTNGFLLDENDNDIIDPQLEKAKLDRARRQDIELNLEVKKKNLIPSDVIETALSGLFSSIKSKILNIPTKAAQRYEPKMSQKKLEKLLKDQVKEVLQGLSEDKALDEIKGI